MRSSECTEITPDFGLHYTTAGHACGGQRRFNGGSAIFRQLLVGCRVARVVSVVFHGNDDIRERLEDCGELLDLSCGGWGKCCRVRFERDGVEGERLGRGPTRPRDTLRAI